MRIFLVILLFITALYGFSAHAGIEIKPQEKDTIKKAPPKIIIGKITFDGNTITKDKIIEREILIKTGDTIPIDEFNELLEQSYRNLINTSLFNFVDYDTIPETGIPNHVNVNFVFQERWYIWTLPIFELADRNFNEWLKKRDWSRLNYGMFLTWNNFRGRREKLIVYSRFGYDERYELVYQVPYVNKKQTLGLGFAGGFSQNHEIAYNSDNNEEVFFKDETKHPIRKFYAYTEGYYRKGIHNNNWVKLEYVNLQITDSVLILNPDYAFGNSNVNEFFNLFYQYKSDYRDYKQYPLTGYYYDVEFDKKGLGILKGSNVNTLSVKSSFRKYFKLKDRLFFASGASAKVSPFWHQPYYYQQGLGYGRYFVRGYEYYVIDGQHYGLFKNNIKFELVPMHITTFNFIPSPKFNKLHFAFYINLFADCGYTWDNRGYVNNPLANDFLFGYGIGIDFVTYYDFVARFEYSFNKFGESGFFIHFLPPI